MKRFFTATFVKSMLVVLGLVFTFANVVTGVTNACSCFVNGQIVCCGQQCQGDGTNCQCTGTGSC